MQMAKDRPEKPKGKKHLLLEIIKRIACGKVERPEWEWHTEIPDEPVLFVSNHTKIYAPSAMILYKPDVRLWVNGYFVHYKECWNHMLKKVLKERPWYLKVLFVAVMPLIIYVFRAIDGIPVYHDTRVKKTFGLVLETMKEGGSTMIFPERTENPVNKYVYEFNKGFTYLGPMYYKRTGKRLKFYPVYFCESLKKVIVGEPVEYNPDLPMNEQADSICRYLESKIAEEGDALPPHDIVFYG